MRGIGLIELLGSLISIGYVAAINLRHVGRDYQANFQTINEVDHAWDTPKAYYFFNNRLEKWSLSGDNVAPENAIPWTTGATNDQHVDVHVYNPNKVIHFTKQRLNVYNQDLTLLNSSYSGDYAYHWHDGTHRWEYNKVFDMGGYTDRFITRMHLNKNSKDHYKWALGWIDGGNRLNYRWLPYIPDDPVDIVPIRRGAGIAILNRNSTLQAHELMNGNILWTRNINIGNPTRGAYMFPKCELVVVDNDERLRIFDTKDGNQKTPPPIEWVNHTFRDMNVVRESDKLTILTNRRVMVLDSDRKYRIAQYRNTTANPAGKWYRFHKGNYRNEYVIGLEDEATHKNFRMYAIEGTNKDVCHPNCGDGCSRALVYCGKNPSKWWKSMWWWKDCHNCTKKTWWCDLPDWAIWGMFLGALLSGLFLILLCLCCCRGNGTRDVHTVENFSNKSAYYEEEEYEEPMNEEVIVEEEVIEEVPIVVEEKVYTSQFAEERFVDTGPAKKVTYSNFRADEYRDNNNLYVSNPVVEEIVEEKIVMKDSFNPYKRKY